MEENRPTEPPSDAERTRLRQEECNRILQGSERVYAALMPLIAVTHGIERVLEMVPELEPEMTAARDRVDGLADHLQAAQNVLVVKLEMLLEEARAELDETQRKAA